MRTGFFIIILCAGFFTSVFAQQTDTSKEFKNKVKSKIDTVYKKIGTSEALKKYKKSIKQFKSKINNKYKTFDSLATDTTKVTQKIKGIIEEINKSLKQNKDSVNTSIANNKIPGSNHAKKDTTRSSILIPGEIKSEQGKDNKETIAGNYVKVGALYMNINKPTEAVSFYEKGLRVAREAKAPEVAQNALRGLYDAYSKKADPKKALFYYQQYAELKDSLFVFKSNQRINDLKSENQIQLLQIDRQKKESELNITRIHVAKQKQAILFIILILFITASITFVIFRQYISKKKINKTLLQQNIIIGEQKKELEDNLIYTTQLKEALKDDLDHYMQLALRKQMNAHFIFNSLNSIQSFIMQNDKLSANIYLSKFASLMRNVLENSSHQLISLSKELEILKLYIELEEQRFDNKFVCNWNISEEINLAARRIPPLIFQPYVENAIWHGLLHKEGERTLTIRITEKENDLLCTIEDNGIGRKAAAEIGKNKIKYESLGTKITQKRIQLINSLNKTGIGIQYYDLNDNNGNVCGTLVELTIPSAEMSILEE